MDISTLVDRLEVVEKRLDEVLEAMKPAMTMPQNDAIKRMAEPVFDRDGYPTDETTDYIANVYAWSFDEYGKWMEFCQEAFNQCYGKIKHTPRTIVFITGGWSGNESVLGAMDANFLFKWNKRGEKRGGMDVWDSVEVVEKEYNRRTVFNG